MCTAARHQRETFRAAWKSQLLAPFPPPLLQDRWFAERATHPREGRCTWKCPFSPSEPDIPQSSFSAQRTADLKTRKLSPMHAIFVPGFSSTCHQHGTCDVTRWLWVPRCPRNGKSRPGQKKYTAPLEESTCLFLRREQQAVSRSRTSRERHSAKRMGRGGKQQRSRDHVTTATVPGPGAQHCRGETRTGVEGIQLRAGSPRPLACTTP